MKRERPVVAILGLGLIGGSLALALRRADATRAVHGYDPDPDALRLARERDAIDTAHDAPVSAAREADVVFLCAPPSACLEALALLPEALAPRAVVTDVGSVKQDVVRAARQRLGGTLSRFVPGHPIAGIERNGMAAARADLFDGQRIILTPLPETEPQAITHVETLWRAAGAERIVHLDAARHDALLALVSHLPHLLAYTLVDCLAAQPEHEELFDCAAGGFADFTRIASSSPRMWHDVCMANRDRILAALDLFRSRLDAMDAALQANDGDTLLNALTRAKRARDNHVDPRGKR